MAKAFKRSLMQAPKGFRDILPADQKYYEFVKQVAIKHLRFSGFKRIDLPVLEYASLFVRGVGEETDIVEKEMFIVERKNKTEEKEEYAMRPEGTAGVARAYIEHGMHTKAQPVMLYYVGPFFRYDQPQEGRYREFWQLGAEILGTAKPTADIELMRVAWNIFEDLGITDISLSINSIGCPHCHPNVTKSLGEFFTLNKSKLCPDCKNRLSKNVFRILDCKEPKCKEVAAEAPPILDTLCVYCKNHLRKVLEMLDELKIKYDLDPTLARGLDYYTRTVFEISMSEDKERKLTLAGGGRYDVLIKNLGGRETPAVGFAIGIDRIVDVLKNKEIEVPDYEKPTVFLIQLGETAKKACYQTLEKLQSEGIPTQATPFKDSLKAQLRTANRLHVRFAVIV
ncbi:MAG: histidine--tRNA ligase, partial [Patescibacteria group bacterium]|nr:histidine--tRNA ligase [Patescibacteria group bacterium]